MEHSERQTNNRDRAPVLGGCVHSRLPFIGVFGLLVGHSHPTMSLSVSFRHSARAEFIEAAAWYESERQTLGVEFIAESERCVAAAAERPMTFTAVYRDVRRVVVMAIFHGSREATGRYPLPHRLPPRPATKHYAFVAFWSERAHQDGRINGLWQGAQEPDRYKRQQILTEC